MEWKEDDEDEEEDTGGKDREIFSSVRDEAVVDGAAAETEGPLDEVEEAATALPDKHSSKRTKELSDDHNKREQKDKKGQGRMILPFCVGSVPVLQFRPPRSVSGMCSSIYCLVSLRYAPLSHTNSPFLSFCFSNLNPARTEKRSV